MSVSFPVHHTTLNIHTTRVRQCTVHTLSGARHGSLGGTRARVTHIGVVFAQHARPCAGRASPRICRCAKLALDRGIGGPVIPASAYLMKSPPEQLPDDVARSQLEEFISAG